MYKLIITVLLFFFFTNVSLAQKTYTILCNNDSLTISDTTAPLKWFFNAKGDSKWDLLGENSSISIKHKTGKLLGVLEKENCTIATTDTLSIV